MTKSQGTKQLVFTGNEVVVQDNRLVESPKSFTQQEFKLFMLLVSKINSETDSDFSTFRIEVSEFAKALNLEQLDYNEFRKVIKRLLRRTIEIRRPKAKHDTEFPLLCKADYFYGKGFAELRINDELKPYLIQLNQQFTMYKLSHILTLSSVYAIHLYELLKQHMALGTYTISIEELKRHLKLSEVGYSRVSNLREKVLDIAQREINQKTDLTVSYSFQKDGRKFSDIVFEIRSKVPKISSRKKKVISDQTYSSFRAEENPKNIAILKSFGYSDLEAIKLLECRSNEDVRLALAAVQEQIQKKEPKNIRAFIKTALDKKWKPKNIEDINNEENKQLSLNETTEPVIESKQITPEKKRRFGGFKLGELLSSLSNRWGKK